MTPGLSPTIVKQFMTPGMSPTIVKLKLAPGVAPTIVKLYMTPGVSPAIVINICDLVCLLPLVINNKQQTFKPMSAEI